MANSKKKCKHCKEFFPAVDMFSAPVGTFCTREHAMDFVAAKQAQEKAKKKESEFKEMKVRVTDAKETIAVLKGRLQKITNKLAKILNHRKDCISCGTDLAKQEQVDGGHFVAVGQCDPMRFNTMNIHPQCVSCNDFKAGNQLEYERRLREIKGDSYVDYLLEQKRVASHIQGDRVWTKESLRLMIKWTNKQLKEVTQ